MRTRYDGCPLCQSTETDQIVTASCADHPLYRKPLPAQMVWNGCHECGHVFTDGYFTPHALSILFTDTNESQRPGDHAEQKRAVWAPTIAAVAQHRPTGAWLDVGFGDGSAMFTATEFGYETTGVDMRRSTVDAMCELGFDARHGDLSTMVAGFDVVSMFDVLEHCPYPTVELEHAHRVLNPDGVLIVSCPNMGCFAWSVLDAHNANPYWGEIEHYHNFTRARLVALMVDAGFEFVSFNVSNRWRLGMEIIARKR